MPRTRSLAWSELKIGIVAVIAIVLAATMIFLLGGDSGFFSDRYAVKTVFPDIAGLKSGAPARLAGVEVGSVTNVEFVGDRVEVTMEIAREHQSRVTTGSRASLGSVSLLGEAAVDITASSAGSPIPEWGYIPSVEASGSVAQVAEKATAGLEEATALIRQIRTGQGTVGRLFTDDSVYKDVSALLQAAERVTAQIAGGRGTLGRLTTDPALYNTINAAVRDLNAITARIRSGEGSLGRLLNDPAFAASLTGTTQNLETLTGRLNRGEGTAGKLVTDSQLYDRMNSITNRLDTLTASLNAGEGTAGQLLKDKRLYENMNQTVSELRDFLAEVKKDPRKYLNIKVSIF